MASDTPQDKQARIKAELQETKVRTFGDPQQANRPKPKSKQKQDRRQGERNPNRSKSSGQGRYQAQGKKQESRRQGDNRQGRPGGNNQGRKRNKRRFDSSPPKSRQAAEQLELKKNNRALDKETGQRPGDKNRSGIGNTAQSSTPNSKAQARPQEDKPTAFVENGANREEERAATEKADQAIKSVTAENMADKNSRDTDPKAAKANELKVTAANKLKTDKEGDLKAAKASEPGKSQGPQANPQTGKQASANLANKKDRRSKSWLEMTAAELRQANEDLEEEILQSISEISQIRLG